MRGPRLGPFTLVEPIGRGSSGVVWRALHTDEGVPAAVKILHTRAGDRAVDDAFRAEVASVAGLSHPGIVWLYDHGTVPEDTSLPDPDVVAGAPWLAMELASLGSLEHMVGWTWPDVIELTQRLLAALGHAHARGLIHRDLKPSNILMAGPGDLRPGPKLSDFGIAHAIGADVQGIVGTPRYMAPEQLRGSGRDLGPWTDLYALGCVTWELVTGRPPFEGSRPADLAHGHLYDLPPAFEPRFDVPEALEAWLRRCLVKDPGHRFRRAAEAAWGLTRLGEARQRAAPPRAPRRDVRTDATLDGWLATGTLDLGSLEDVVAPSEPVTTVAPAHVESPPMPADWRDDQHDEDTPAPLHGTGLGLVVLRNTGLVGREPEQDALWRRLRAVQRDGTPRVVLVQGPAGVGKSALARWLVERVHETGAAYPFTILHEPGGSGGTGLLHTIRRNLGIDQLDVERALPRIQRYLARRGHTDADEARALADLLLVDDLGSHRSPDARERLALLVRLLFLETRNRPVVVWMDDVTYGEASLEFVSHVLASGARAPALFVLTARSETVSESRGVHDLLDALQANPATTRLDLSPLAEEDTVTLVRRLLPLHEPRARRVARRVGGNPLFLVHLLADWAHHGLLYNTPDGWDLKAGAVTSLPDDLHEVWHDRLQRLLVGPFAHACPSLEIAAALGASVDDTEWREAVALAGVTIPTGLVARLARERLAVPTAEGWRFVHRMLQESIARSAREAGRWRAANLACADMLAHRVDLGAVARRGSHLIRADEPAKAADLLLEVARLYLRREDVRLADRALELVGVALSRLTLDDDDRRVCEEHLLAARIDKERNELDRARERAHAAALSAKRQGWLRLEAEALAEQADIARVRGGLPDAWLLFQSALAAHARQDDDAGVADTLRNLSAVALHLGDAAGAESQLVEASERYDRLGDRIGAALCRAGLGDLARSRGDLHQAEVHYQTSLTVLRAEGHRGGIALGLHGLAEVNRFAGRLADAEAGYAEVARLEEALGRDPTFGRLNLALCRIAQRRFAEALPELEHVERAWRAQGRPGYLAVAHAAALPCRAALHQWATWTHDLAEAERLLAESAFVDIDVARVLEAAADEAERAGHPDEAVRALELARVQWQALGQGAQVRALDERLAGAAQAGTHRPGSFA